MWVLYIIEAGNGVSLDNRELNVESIVALTKGAQEDRTQCSWNPYILDGKLHDRSLG